jgi:short-subunit dehydrogenase
MPTALITGASAGLGAEFARALAARGYDLILVARRLDRLEELAVSLKDVRVECLPANLTVDQDVERVAARCGELHLLVNNAGFGTKGLFGIVKLETQLAMHKLHVMTTVRLTHAALQGMMLRNSGAVINVSSVAAFTHSPGNVSYCATKSWMTSFTEGLNLELRAKNSRVHIQSLCPGFTYTEFHDVMGASRDSIAKSLWMTSEFVVNESLSGLDQRKWLVIPGWRYRWFVTWFTRLPLWLREAIQLRTPYRRNLSVTVPRIAQVNSVDSK